MKKSTIILIACLFTIVSHPTLAKKRQQSTKQQKEELKKWKKRKASMQPLQLKALVEENYKLSKKVKKMQANNEILEGIIEFKTRLLEQKEWQERQAAEISNSMPLMGTEKVGKYEWAVDENGRSYVKGIVFKVQIGAYKQRDLQPMLEEEDTQEIFAQEQSEGLNKYTLMYFSDYWQANQFKKELRAMGLEDAFVVAFQDGVRVPLKTVLPEVIQQKQ